jgi:hypothetical protein
MNSFHRALMHFCILYEFSAPARRLFGGSLWLKINGKYKSLIYYSS